LVGTVKAITDGKIIFSGIKKFGLPPRLVTIHLIQAIPSSDRFSQILNQCTQIGVCEFVPIMSERSPVQLKNVSDPGKLNRWKSIVKSAAEQSGQPEIPTIQPPQSMSTFLSRFSLAPKSLHLVLWENETQTHLKTVLQSSEATDIWVVAGPEGGFGFEEVAHLNAGGFQSVSLGPSILRVEIAGLVAASQILYEKNV
jgi:16S rRNA (uracil1498-N3)-methyltransferase